MTRLLLYINIVLLAVLVSGTGCTKDDEGLSGAPLQIGVMLPLSGEFAAGYDISLDWAVENINRTGGVAGRRLELVKRDLRAGEEVEAISDELIADTAVKAVIGPFTTTQVFKVAPKFINGKKVFIAPVASAASLSRAFSGYDYFWRLTEPDISQTKTLLLLAQKGGAHRVGLITEESEYGSSFEDWFGYFATELGLEVSAIRVLNPGDTAVCSQAWHDMADTNPDAVVSTLILPAQNIALVRAFRADGRQIRLLMSDFSVFPAITEQLGPLAENLEGTTFSSDPSAGFDVSYRARYGENPGFFQAAMYDAVMLIALALESSDGEGGAALADALKKVVSGRAGECRWHRDGLRAALDLISEGTYPDILGASGSLDFDEQKYTDVRSTTYGHWRVDDGEFVVTDYYTSDGGGRISSTSAAYQVIANKRQEFSGTGNWPVPAARTGLKAFLMAGSQGYSNYRHQSDVLKAYQTLKSRGVSDNDIILVMADDIAGSSLNKKPGSLFNDPGGENLYINVQIDYHLDEITSGMLADILLGNRTAATPVVLESTVSDNVFFFTAGHGTPDGMVFDGMESEKLTPAWWSGIFSQMREGGRFRRIFWSVESCYSGKIGEVITTPGVLLMTGANPFETSKAYQYDSGLGIWLGDKFAWAINHAMTTTPGIAFSQLYEQTFSFVNGSHISFYNYQNFGNIYEIRLNEFITP
jgi:ABC-type branched-subunit amino acid transport system substrate-binding protein